jgi:hypothetical protein
LAIATSNITDFVKPERISPSSSSQFDKKDTDPPAACAEKLSISDSVGSSNVSVVVDAMCGEGTLELEAFDSSRPASYFLLSGDKCEEVVSVAKERLQSVRSCSRNDTSSSPCSNAQFQGSRSAPLQVDFVVWDAQRLPLRDGIADAFLGDLPIAGACGSKRLNKRHQEPRMDLGSRFRGGDGGEQPDQSEVPVDYQKATIQALRILVPGSGRAALVSVDSNSLARAILAMTGHFRILHRNNVTIGGLPGKMFLLQRRQPPTKDISVWLPPSLIPSGKIDGPANSRTCGGTVKLFSAGYREDLSSAFLEMATKSCKGFWIDDFLALHQSASTDHCQLDGRFHRTLVHRVELIDVYTNTDKDDRISHCYRISFDALLSNHQAKILEKVIRSGLEKDPPYQIELR